MTSKYSRPPPKRMDFPISGVKWVRGYSTSKSVSACKVDSLQPSFQAFHVTYCTCSSVHSFSSPRVSNTTPNRNHLPFGFRLIILKKLLGLVLVVYILTTTVRFFIIPAMNSMPGHGKESRHRLYDGVATWTTRVGGCPKTPSPYQLKRNGSP